MPAGATHRDETAGATQRVHRPSRSDTLAIQAFSTLPRADIDLIASLSTLRLARRGETISTQRSAADPVCFVISGRFQLSLCRHFRKQVLLRIVGPGEHFGELHALTGLSFDLIARAETEARYIQMASEDFVRLLRELPGLSLRLLTKTACQSLAQIERIFELSTLHLRDRVRAEILRLATGMASNGAPLVISPAPTHEMFASIVGGTREGVTRELRALTREGVIAVARRQITITDVDRLRASLETHGSPAA